MIAKFLSALFNSRTQAHYFHLQTESFAAHKALQAYYEGIIPFIDGIAESYQGAHGIITGYEPAKVIYQGDEYMISYFEALRRFVEGNRDSLPQDSDLQNQIDEVITLIKSTQYLLQQLS